MGGNSVKRMKIFLCGKRAVLKIVPEREILEFFVGKYRKNEKIDGINGKNGHDKKAHT